MTRVLKIGAALFAAVALSLAQTGTATAAAQVSFEKRSGPDLLTFDFEGVVPGAAFQRNGDLWLVFDGIAPEEVTDQLDALGDQLAPRKIQQSDGATIIILPSGNKTAARVISAGRRWVIALDPVYVPDLSRPMPVTGASVIAGPGGRVISAVDPANGKRFAIVVSSGPVRAAGQDVLYGAVFEDGGAQAVEPGGTIDLDAPPPGGSLDDGRFFGIPVDLVGWAGGANPDYWQALQEFETTLAAADGPAARRNATLALVQFHLANDNGAEALGFLTTLEDRGGPDARQILLTGIAQSMLARWPEALKTLEHRRLARDGHASLWRGLALVNLKRFDEAHGLLGHPGGALDSYSPPWQAAFRIAAARASLETGRANSAFEVLRSLPSSNELVAVLRSRVAEAQGRDMAALEELSGVTEALGVARRAVLQAQLGLTEWQLARQTLQDLQFDLMGQADGAGDLKILARLNYFAGATPDAMRLLARTLELADTSVDRRALRAELGLMMAAGFDGDALDASDPVVAAGLFYDLRNHIPVGPLGDRVVLGHAAQLADMGLKRQAAELLQYQIDNRLKGVKRARAAIRLAGLALDIEDPTAALLAARKGRHAELSTSERDQRTAYEARALVAVDAGVAALELLADPGGPHTSRARADVLFRQGQWSAASLAFERLSTSGQNIPASPNQAPLAELEHLQLLTALRGGQVQEHEPSATWPSLSFLVQNHVSGQYSPVSRRTVSEIAQTSAFTGIMKRWNTVND